MKKVLVSTILGLATATSVFAQGSVLLDNYNTSGPLVTYGAGSGGTVGEGIASGFNVSLYYFVGNSASTVNAGFDGTGYDTPTGMTLALAGDTGAVAALDGAYGPGLFANVASFLVPGTAVNPNPNSTVTLVMIAYNGSSYENSTVRGHSLAFTMAAENTFAPLAVGTAMPAFSVYSVAAVPEPSTFALAGLGLASLVIFRRRK